MVTHCLLHDLFCLLPLVVRPRCPQQVRQAQTTVVHCKSREIARCVEQPEGQELSDPHVTAPMGGEIEWKQEMKKEAFGSAGVKSLYEF